MRVRVRVKCHCSPPNAAQDDRCSKRLDEVFACEQAKAANNVHTQGKGWFAKAPHASHHLYCPVSQEPQRSSKRMYWWPQEVHSGLLATETAREQLARVCNTDPHHDHNYSCKHKRKHKGVDSTQLTRLSGQGVGVPSTVAIFSVAELCAHRTPLSNTATIAMKLDVNVTPKPPVMDSITTSRLYTFSQRNPMHWYHTPICLMT